ARLRDVFYQQLLPAIGGAHGARLRQEATALRQPFGGARQHLNAYLARQRALQLQQRHLSLVFADMGYPEAAREEAARIPEAAARGEGALTESVSAQMKQLAGWWDQFATTSVGEVRPVHGGEAVASAAQVAEALARWRQRGEASADLAFWREHLQSFRSPKA